MHSLRSLNLHGCNALQRLRWHLVCCCLSRLLPHPWPCGWWICASCRCECWQQALRQLCGRKGFEPHSWHRQCG